MTPEERLDALEASLLALWQVVEQLSEADVAPKLEGAHQALVARIRASREASA